MSDTGVPQQPAASVRDPLTPPEYPSGKEASAKDGFFFLSIINHMKNKLEVDWEAVAGEVGYSNGTTAKVRFGQIKRKLGYKGEEANGKQGTKLIKKSGSKVGFGINKITKAPTKRTPKKSKVTQAAEADALLQSIEVDDHQDVV
ncbi:hypothetical protein BGZ60DRAFT_434804 [Tricladium varicosporioides]|nr:hypothetical protein BGZ60DRAFT_434804 [Hymenoscyphus varicosporioides]